jgi:superfamily II DNA or RNA helicase
VPTFDLAVADEAHRCAGKADAGFATILDADKIRASKRLFTTATPRYFGKAIKDEAKARDLAVVGMDDEAIFGPVIHKLTFGQAIEQELLTDYQVVIVGVDEPMVRKWIENYEIVSTDPDNQTDARTLAAKIGMLKAVKDYDLKRVISFHSRVAGAKQFADELVDVANLIEPANRPEGTFLSDYVSGAMKAGDRKEKIDRLKVLEGYDRGILTNARCLAEGVDVPSLDGVAFIDPKGSQVEIIQAVGRAIRKVRGATIQKKGTIVLPVFIEDGDDHEASIEASNFKPVWEILRALRAHDEVLADSLDQYRTNMAKNASQSREDIIDKIIFDMPISVDAEFSSALRTVLVEASTSSWEFWFGLLERFKALEGHCRVTKLFELDSFKLGSWVGGQRKAKDRISPERKQRLDDIGFIWDPRAEAWEEGFSNLLQFKEREGHCSVPTGLIVDEFKLGVWNKIQRATKHSLSPERKQRLDEIGFVWDVLTLRWEDGFNSLIQFKETEGHCNVQIGYKLDGFALHGWVMHQRSTKDHISPERKKRLDEIGFVWDVLTEMWEEGFIKLLQFKELEGHCRVPHKRKLEGFNLGNWVGTQRAVKDSLPPERKQRLDDIGFIWDPHAEAWEEGFSNLLQFKETEGHCRVARSIKLKGFNLGSWVGTQRAVKDSLPPERKQRLDDIGFIWDPHAEAWKEGFAKLLQFKEREGHCSVPTGLIVDEFKLGVWNRNQRKTKDSMSPERKQRLDNIGFIWAVGRSKI